MNKIIKSELFPPDKGTLMLQETLFHNANGYIGVRASLEEGVPEGFATMRGMYVNGVYDIIPMKQSESLCNLIEEKDTMLNIADVQTVKLCFGDEEFSMFSGEVRDFSRSLDMDAGVSKRELLWCSPQGKRVRLKFTRMASFVRKNLFTIECEILPENFSGIGKITSLHCGLARNYAAEGDPRVGSESAMLLKPMGFCEKDGATYLESATSRSGIGLCTGVKHEFSKPVDENTVYDAESHSYTAEYSCRIECGETLRFVKYVAVADSLRSEHCREKAEECMSTAFGRLAEMLDEQRKYLKSFWDNCGVLIDSDDDSGTAMLFNQYQLLQSCGSDGICSVASKGLSGEGYEGHYFWDTEIYVLPFFASTVPDMARKLLRYRYSTLPLARENAKLLGHKSGALYPWRTISGRECSGFFPAGTAQYHINGDIAYAVVQYYLSTGDLGYLSDEGAEILIETARLWMDVGHFHKGKFVINDVTGPDEYTCIVNNNFYTNACARYNLRWACRAAALLQEKGLPCPPILQSELDNFLSAADNMYLPYDEELGINPQDDSFLHKPVWDFAGTPRENYPLLLHYHPLHLYRHQVCKQADTVLAYYLFDGVADRKTQLKSYEYYEKITTHDSSLSNCIFSVEASRLGLRDKAWGYFGDSIKSDLTDSHGNTCHGIHTANMGGSWMMTVSGFAGMKIGDKGLSLDPFVPEAWRGYSFRICYMGSRLEVSVNRDRRTVRLLNEKPVCLKMGGKTVRLTAENAEYTEEKNKQ